MTVYFISPVGDRSKLKVGFTTDLPTRMRGLAAEFKDGIELVALCDGGRETERAFLSILDPHLIEGEWFHRVPAVEAIVAPFMPNVSGKRIWSRLRAVQTMSSSPLEEDREIAFGLLQQLMSKYGAIHFGIAQRRAYEELAVINPMWTSRRVRAIWERKARRIDHYEIRDLNLALIQWGRGEDVATA